MRGRTHDVGGPLLRAVFFWARHLPCLTPCWRTGKRTHFGDDMNIDTIPTPVPNHVNGKSGSHRGKRGAHDEHGPSTRVLHAGASHNNPHHSLTPPIIQTATYTFEDTADLIGYLDERMFADEILRHDYGRYGNPTVQAVEKRLAALENADEAVLLSSGMAAITISLLILLSTGDQRCANDDRQHICHAPQFASFGLWY